MSHICLHAIIVTGFPTVEKHLEKAHVKACEIFPVVSPIIPSGLNGVKTFLIPPDGSYEIRPESILGDKCREEFKTWLRTQSNEELPPAEDMSVLRWVEVLYGDDLCNARVEAENYMEDQ